MTRTKDEIESNRRRLKKEYGELYNEVSNLLFRLDPVGISFENNSDEYESETGTILPRLNSCESVLDAQKMIHEEFVRWFDLEIAGPESHYAEIAKKIWELWTAGKKIS